MSLFVSGWRIVSGAFFTVRFAVANLADAPHGRRCGFLAATRLPFFSHGTIIIITSNILHILEFVVTLC